MKFPFKPKFVVLAILDGWGIAPDSPGNAISIAKTVNFDKFWISFPHTQLEASGESVGLPRGEDGNTETGHLNLGAGRIVYQDLQRINMAIADGSFFDNEILVGAIDHAKRNSSNLHLMGLLGAGGVHSNIEHIFALIQLASRLKFNNVYIHVFTDGRDSPTTAAKTYITQLNQVINKEGIGKIASIMGRYWAMDRDQRWERTQKAYNALTRGEGDLVKDETEAIEKSYAGGITDEFMNPCLITKDGKNPIALIGDDDSVVFFNFRVDRPRQLTKAFILEDFSKAPMAFDFNTHHLISQVDQKSQNKLSSKEPFERGPRLNNLYFATMTEYSKTLSDAGAKPAFPPEIIDMPISGVISIAGLRQLKVTESEKERFVTFYFNGLRDKAYQLEERNIVPSAKVSTYDRQPEMSADAITKSVLNKLSMGQYELVVINYANADMVGHTGNIGACVNAVEKVDESIGKIANYVLAYEGVLIITADHGNAEEMINLKTGEIDTEHSTNPVPFIVISKSFVGMGQKLRSGILADVSPTILNLLSLPQPASMTGRDLLSDLNI